MIQNYFYNAKRNLGSLISNARAREGWRKGNLPFLFSKNHRLARKAKRRRAETLGGISARQGKNCCLK